MFRFCSYFAARASQRPAPGARGVRIPNSPAIMPTLRIEEVHLVSTVFMAGLIVFVQIVHYPLMARVGRDGFVEYERAHTVRTGWVVVPPMVAELATAVWLAAVPATPELRGVAFTGMALLAVIWISTAALQAPAHGRLVDGFDPGVHRRLVLTNWIRTVAWVARVPVALALVSR